MANQIIGNVIVVDSAMGNTNWLIVNSTNLPDQIYVNAIKISMSDTSNTFQLSASDTTQVLVELDKLEPLIHFSNPQVFRNFKIPTLSAGTAWIYLA